VLGPIFYLDYVSELVIPFVCLYRQEVFAYKRYNWGYLIEGKGKIVVPKNTEETIRTSVVLNKRLWSRFRGQIWDRLGVSELSSALDILIDQWLEGAAPDSNAPHAASTQALVPVLPPDNLKTVYVDPQLRVLHELTARAWRESESDELAKTVISLLKIYGDNSGSRMG
jgi:hypothetical protein